MKIELRSAASTMGRRMAGARALWRANGLHESHFGKPIIAIANSFTQFVPGHVHLHEIGQRVKAIIEAQGCFAAEFNTIAIDDGIAMGHDGMLYSLPSRDLIADSVEYMCRAHTVDALLCIGGCDKITPGMLMAAMRLNIPAVIVSSGPMEAGVHAGRAYDLIDAMVMAADPAASDDAVAAVERAACPTCGSCSGMFTANSMNCLCEALGMALPGNGTVVATHVMRTALFERAAQLIVTNARRYYEQGDRSVLPRSIATKQAFVNAMTVDITMGGSTNTVLHLPAIAHAAGVRFTVKDMDRLSRKVPVICKVAPSAYAEGKYYHLEDVGRAGGIPAIMGILARAGLLDTTVRRVDGTLAEMLTGHDVASPALTEHGRALFTSAPGRRGTNLVMGSQDAQCELDLNRATGCIRDMEHCYMRDGGLAVLYGNVARDGCVVKSAGVDPSMLRFTGRARVFDSQEQASEGILKGKVKAGDVVVIRYEGPKGGPGMQEMLYPTSYLRSAHLDKQCALLTDGRFSGGSSGLSVGHVSPEAAAGGEIGLVRTGDTIAIDIPKRRIDVALSKAELDTRRRVEKRKGSQAFRPARKRVVSEALRAYALMVTSADRGAVRVVPDLEGR